MSAFCEYKPSLYSVNSFLRVYLDLSQSSTEEKGIKKREHGCKVTRIGRDNLECVGFSFKKKKVAAWVAEDTKPSLLWSSLILAVSSGGSLVPDSAGKPTLLCFSVQALTTSLCPVQFHEMWELNHFGDCMLCQT